MLETNPCRRRNGAVSSFLLLGLTASLLCPCAGADECQQAFEEGQLAGNPEVRIQHYSNAISLCTDPEDRDLLYTSYYNRGVRYFNKGDLDQAESDLQMALQTDPVGSNTPTVRGILEQIARRRNRNDRSGEDDQTASRPSRPSRVSSGMTVPRTERFKNLEIECDGGAVLGETFLCRVRSPMPCRFTKVPFPKSADYRIVGRKRLTIKGKSFAPIPDDDAESAVYFTEWMLKPLAGGSVTVPPIRMRCGDWTGSTEEAAILVSSSEEDTDGSFGNQEESTPTIPSHENSADAARRHSMAGARALEKKDYIQARREWELAEKLAPDNPNNRKALELLDRIEARDKQALPPRKRAGQ